MNYTENQLFTLLLVEFVEIKNVKITQYKIIQTSIPLIQ